MCVLWKAKREVGGGVGRALLCHSPVAEETILDHFDDEGSSVFFAQTGVEALPEWENGSSATEGGPTATLISNNSQRAALT